MGSAGILHLVDFFVFGNGIFDGGIFSKVTALTLKNFFKKNLPFSWEMRDNRINYKTISSQSQ